jgi:hypothetical protein
MDLLRRRYQNHVGAYDKAKWEQSIEERILHGIAHISTKSAKLGNDLIDIDLVQGNKTLFLHFTFVYNKIFIL